MTEKSKEQERLSYKESSNNQVSSGGGTSSENSVSPCQNYSSDSDNLIPPNDLEEIQEEESKFNSSKELQNFSPRDKSKFSMKIISKEELLEKYGNKSSREKSHSVSSEKVQEDNNSVEEQPNQSQTPEQIIAGIKVQILNSQNIIYKCKYSSATGCFEPPQTHNLKIPMHKVSRKFNRAEQEQFYKFEALSKTKKQVIRREIGPKQINNYDRQQFSKFTQKVIQENQLLEKNRLVVCEKTFKLVRGEDAPEPIQETEREYQLSVKGKFSSLSGLLSSKNIGHRSNNDRVRHLMSSSSLHSPLMDKNRKSSNFSRKFNKQILMLKNSNVSLASKKSFISETDNSCRLQRHSSLGIGEQKLVLIDKNGISKELSLEQKMIQKIINQSDILLRKRQYSAKHSILSGSSISGSGSSRYIKKKKESGSLKLSNNDIMLVLSGSEDNDDSACRRIAAQNSIEFAKISEKEEEYDISKSSFNNLKSLKSSFGKKLGADHEKVSQFQFSNSIKHSVKSFNNPSFNNPNRINDEPDLQRSRSENLVMKVGRDFQSDNESLSHLSERNKLPQNMIQRSFLGHISERDDSQDNDIRLPLRSFKSRKTNNSKTLKQHFSNQMNLDEIRVIKEYIQMLTQYGLRLKDKTIKLLQKNQKYWFEIKSSQNACCFSLKKSEKIKVKHLAKIDSEINYRIVKFQSKNKKQKTQILEFNNFTKLSEISIFICTVNYLINVQNGQNLPTNAKYVKFKILSKKLLGNEREKVVGLFKDRINYF